MTERRPPSFGEGQSQGRVPDHAHIEYHGPHTDPTTLPRAEGSMPPPAPGEGQPNQPTEATRRAIEDRLIFYARTIVRMRHEAQRLRNLPPHLTTQRERAARDLPEIERTMSRLVARAEGIEEALLTLEGADVALPDWLVAALDRFAPQSDR